MATVVAAVVRWRRWQEFLYRLVKVLAGGRVR